MNDHVVHASAAQLADVGTITVYMAICGEWAAPLFLIYLWVTFGSGFRFGPKYLVTELIMAVFHHHAFATSTRPTRETAELVWSFCLAALGGKRPA